MKVFECGHCNHPLFFENNECENCGHACGYRDHDRKMLTFDTLRSTLISDREKIEYKYCKNKDHGVCNWLLEKEDTNQYCSACQLNRTIPNLSDKKNFLKWQNLEVAKHRLIYQLQKTGLELPSKIGNNEGLCFDFIAKRNNPKIMTGHFNGVITILLREADSVIREQTRKELQEPYRTLIGHLRHEVGHYFWERLVFIHPEVLKAFRVIFGNEEANYSEALQSYYDNGAPVDWQDSFISKYATSHPWEDWAETWAHYLHIMDMVETAHFFRLRVKPTGASNHMKAKVTFDPYKEKDFKTIINTCIPLSFAVNSINRAMGLPDVYPFVVNEKVIEKMTFIHQLLLPKRAI
ncbi:putative zinc-binding metallopeptidase [Ascidiimonas sp. W6]|uniref:zinc-binding metallopeptidase family protein n=1 Tax=Ascidiimonas meishanensis TaxID=3128903 RepID=UPI0030EBA3F5